jgi:glycogen(starch) synthase
MTPLSTNGFCSPAGTPLAITLDSMKERGVKLIYGRWLIEGAPKVILFDTGSVYNR